jgi:uncharacterized membrane protein YfcA
VSVLFGGVLFLLGMVGAFISGLVGVGGAIVMIPLLLYAPPLLGLGRLDVKAVAAITMVQVFVAALSGVIAHGRHRAVNMRLAMFGGVVMATGSLAGALGSHWMPASALLLVFALMVTAALALMLVPTPLPDVTASAADRPYSRRRIVAVAGSVGVGAGLVGAGGAFLLVPLLLVVVGVPIRVTIGSSLAMTALAATTGVVGKLVTGQIPLGAALIVALGAVPGAQLGALVSRRLAGGALKGILFVVIVITGIRVWWDVLFE